MLKLLGHSVNRVSNGPVECYFGNLKNDVLSTERNLKVSRLIRKLRSNVLTLCKEIHVKIGKECLTRRRTKKRNLSSEIRSQEQWAKKSRPKNTYYRNRYINTAPVIQDSSSSSSSTEPTSCCYCSRGILDTTTNWVQCDRCKKWIHQDCDEKTDKTYTKDFICKFCENDCDLKCAYCFGRDFNVTTDWVQCDICKQWIHQKCDSSERTYSGSFSCKYCFQTTADERITAKFNNTYIHQTTTLKFLPNGLIDDVEFYATLPNKIHYTVAYYNNINYSQPDLISDSYTSLNPKTWLDNFSIDILLRLINKKPAIQIIEINIANIIFQMTYTNDFAESFSIKESTETLAMPLLINNNHWCLLISLISTSM